MIFESFSYKDTLEYGKSLVKNAAPGTVFTLDGDLGAGKTVLTKGIAEELGITVPVCSPTFTVLQIYEEGRLPLYHFDVYRIEDPEEMEEIGYREYFYGEGICVVEWSELIRELIPESAIKVIIRKDLSKGPDYRRIEVTGIEAFSS